MDSIYLGTKIVDVFEFAEAGYAICPEYLPPQAEHENRNLPSIAVVMFRKVPIGMCQAGEAVLVEPSEAAEAAVRRIREDLSAYDAAMVSLAKEFAKIPSGCGKSRNLLWWSSVAIVGCRDDATFSATEDKNPTVCDGVVINSTWATLLKDTETSPPLKRVGGGPPRVLSFSVDSRVTVSREFAKGWRIDTIVEVNTLWELVVESHLVRHVKV